MALMDMPRHAAPDRRTDARQAALMLLVVYPACLLAALAARAAAGSGDSERMSIFAEARAQAAACIAFVFR